MNIHDAGVRNPVTGLMEIRNAHFAVPWVAQESIGSLRLLPHINALHRVPVKRASLTLDFYAQLKPSDTLVVVFHGANSARSYSYPRFERVKTFTHTTSAFLSFADPTLNYHRDLELCWYAGGPDYDPLDDMLAVVEHAREVVGAKQIIYTGGSGGGLPALRLSAHTENSLAFTQSTATVVSNSLPRAVDRYFDKVWPGMDKTVVLAKYSHRFDMSALYSDLEPVNKVYMLQNLNDPYYIANHYRPFKTRYIGKDPSGLSSDGRKQFVLYDSERLQHGPPTPEEWQHHWERACMML